MTDDAVELMQNSMGFQGRMLDYHREDAEMYACWMREVVKQPGYWAPNGTQDRYGELFLKVHDLYKKARKEEWGHILFRRQRQIDLINLGIIEEPEVEGDPPAWESWRDVLESHSWVEVIENFGSDEHIQKELAYHAGRGEFPGFPIPSDVIADAVSESGWWGVLTYRIAWNDAMPEFIKEIGVEFVVDHPQERWVGTTIYTGGEHIFSFRQESSPDAFTGTMTNPDNMYECLQKFYAELFNYVRRLQS